MKNKLLKFFAIFFVFIVFGIYAKSTIIKIDDYCYRENNVIYFSGTEDKRKIDTIKDPKTFERVGIYSGEYKEGSLYYKDSKYIYCDIKSVYEELPLAALDIIIGGDPQTLKQKYKYERIYLDKNNLYFNCEKIQGGDPNTFSKNKYGEYFDKNNVYQEYGAYEVGTSFISNITGADSETFKRINHKIDFLAFIYKDKNHIFLETNNSYSLVNIITGSDSQTFRAKVFKYNGRIYYFFKDKNNLYFNNENDFGSAINKISGIDPNTFKFLTANIIMDKNSVFTIGENGSSNVNNFHILNGSDANSFKLYFKTNNFQIFKDKNQLYYGYISTTNTYDDKTHKYKTYSTENKIYAIPTIDIKSFTYIDGLYAKDKNYIYYLGNEIYKIEGVDRNSFNVKGERKAEDKNYIYNGFNKTKK